VRGFPLLDAVDGKKEIGIRIDIPSDVDDPGWAEELRGLTVCAQTLARISILTPATNLPRYLTTGSDYGF
jgi:hypothetical protein